MEYSTSPQMNSRRLQERRGDRRQQKERRQTNSYTGTSNPFLNPIESAKRMLNGVKHKFGSKSLTGVFIKNHKLQLAVINVILFALLALLSFNASAGGDLYCKIHDRTVLTRMADGSADTIQLHIGCTQVPEGDKLLKIRWNPVDAEELQEIFLTEEDSP